MISLCFLYLKHIFHPEISKNIIRKGSSSIFDIIGKKDQFHFILRIVILTVLCTDGLHLLYARKELLIKILSD